MFISVRSSFFFVNFIYLAVDLPQPVITLALNLALNVNLNRTLAAGCPRSCTDRFDVDPTDAGPPPLIMASPFP